MVKRIAILEDKKSFFLFGPRQVGKSTLIQELLTPDDLYINLLPQRTHLTYTNDAGRFREEVQSHLKHHPKGRIVVDEVQKVPALLDEVHDFIERRQGKFTLTGSSARKLKKSGANMLAGRAYIYRLFPLNFLEFDEKFTLKKALVQGCLPALWYGNEDSKRFLQAYCETYLAQEIQAEGIVRNLAPFAKFLEIAASFDSEIINFSAFARDCGVSYKTIQEYFQILEDTFLITRVEPWMESAKKRLVSHSRYYFFDTGVVNCLTHNLQDSLDVQTSGKRFEQFIVNQIIALNEYWSLGFKFYYWRTTHGSEVDLLLTRGKKICAAIEIKYKTQIHPIDTKGLKSFQEESPKVPCYIISCDDNHREINSGIENIEWKNFLVQKLKEL